MSLPVCPRCQSAAVEPNAFNAGENVCRACGHSGAVATFHPPGATVYVLSSLSDTTRTTAGVMPRRGVKHDPIADEKILPKRRYWD